MTHLPECYKEGSTDSCICDELRACEQRVREEWYEAQSEAWEQGFQYALDAAREAVAEQKLVPLAKQGRFIITRNTKLWKQRQAWSELGWWDFRTSALAAIDALRENND